MMQHPESALNDMHAASDCCQDTDGTQGTTYPGEHVMPPSAGNQGGMTSGALGGGNAVSSGQQYANDVPHYTSQGFVAGRPQEVNNPASAGELHGSPHQDPGFRTGGVTDGSVHDMSAASPAAASHMQPQTYPGGYQTAPPSMPSQSHETAYPNMSAYAAGYQTVPPQMPPQGGYQNIPPGMPEGQGSFQTATFQMPPQGGYYGTSPQMPPQSGPAPVHPMPDQAHHPKFEEHKYGQFVEVVNGFINGEPDIPKTVGLLENCDLRFWKGAIVGVVASLILTNKTVQTAVTGTLGGIMGAFQKESQEQPTQGD